MNRKRAWAGIFQDPMIVFEFLRTWKHEFLSCFKLLGWWDHACRWAIVGRNAVQQRIKYFYIYSNREGYAGSLQPTVLIWYPTGWGDQGGEKARPQKTCPAEGPALRARKAQKIGKAKKARPEPNKGENPIWFSTCHVCSLFWGILQDQRPMLFVPV